MHQRRTVQSPRESTTRPLRLLVAAIAWPPETFLARLIDGLLESGVEVTAACSSVPSAAWRQKSNFRWIYAPAWDGSALGRGLGLAGSAVGAILRSPPAAARLLASREAVGTTASWWNRLLPFAGRRWDVVYLPWIGSEAYYAPLFETGAPVVVSCRGSQVHIEPHDPRRGAGSMSRSFARAAAVHCVSEDIRNVAARHGLDVSRSTVIRPGVDTEAFRPPDSRRENGRFRIVSVGSLVWKKGYEYALTAVHRLADVGVPVRYDVVGDGPDRQRVRYTIVDLELEDHVRLWGRRSPSEVRAHLVDADVFLHASLSEGISNAVLEAMACGLPVVTTDCGGMREAVTDGVEGRLVPVRDPDAAAEALRLLASDVDLRRRMGSAARGRAVSEFPLDAHVRAFANLFRRVAA